jgi:hypothetical protein
MKRGPPEEPDGGGSSTARAEKRLASAETGRKRSLLNALAKLAGTQVQTFFLILSLPYKCFQIIGNK